MEAPHHMAIRELDLSAYHPNPLVDRVNAMPGLKTSAAFFTFLRANLVLHSAMSSATSTPRLGPSSPFAHIVAPSPFSDSASISAEQLFDLDDDNIDIPPLSLEVLESRRDKVDGLRLVADSIAQMRQRASVALVFHPLCLAGLSAALATVYQFGFISSLDAGVSMTVSCGVFMSYLMGIRYLAGGYVSLAERLRWGWLRADDGEEDTILAARYNDEIIGSLVLRLEPNPAALAGPKRKYRSVALRGGKGVIRAWTTSLRYRGKGVGKDLLFEAVRITKERCGRDAEVGFAQEHANSAMLLPAIFNAPFRRDEILATKALDEVLADYDVVKRRR
ncbi:hypothetical protein B0J13DRAFT_278661 [Dactylonectria estremocensis]|uniref:N-acetyltransferase domain-containing protein n=1 Tax=Dactylonectria estremocensis TaxID=1079267 RepID=A0A9P9F2E3_9HYPO|nr:hypothetical protein B0J13DRAFT_278661 [Dactylonectria estremocensis]